VSAAAPSLTLCTTCKPLRGRAAVSQGNALRSWARLGPGVEVVVLGDEPGVAEICAELGFRCVPEIPRNAWGTPVVSGLFELARREARGELVGWVNSDIILTPDLLPALARVRERFERFLLLVRRWNVDLEADWDYAAPDSEERLRRFAREHGELEPSYGGMDVFVFPRSVELPLPPFAIGRGRWDSALIYQARRLGIPVIDATEAVLSLHQNHDYVHIDGGTQSQIKGPEAQQNEEMLGGEAFIFTALNATHRLTPDGLERLRVRSPAGLLRVWATLPALHPRLRGLERAVSALAPLWRKAAALQRRLQRRVRERRSPRPYPVSVARRGVAAAVPPGGGVETFDSSEAQHINRARMEHLLGLGLPLAGRSVLEAGSGPGYLGQYLVEAGCEVTSVDAREANLERLRELFPQRRTRVFDLDADDPKSLGEFDVVLAYGVLYHLENPLRALRSLAALARELILIETQVLDHPLPLVRYEEETSTFSQALRNLACRPTPSFVVLALRNAGFPYVYAPLRPPDHPDYRGGWKGDLATARGGALLRAVFVASRVPLFQPTLVDLLA
jgi:2-polyprenyl-3-methyl-5-hydroxy-6-metoxy-1,4-benzoquinol methylase